MSIPRVFHGLDRKVFLSPKLLGTTTNLEWHICAGKCRIYAKKCRKYAKICQKQSKVIIKPSYNIQNGNKLAGENISSTCYLDFSRKTAEKGQKLPEMDKIALEVAKPSPIG